MCPGAQQHVALSTERSLPAHRPFQDNDSKRFAVGTVEEHVRAWRVPNQRLRLLLADSGWTGEQLARRINELGAEAGIALQYQRASVTHWLAGMRPRPPVPQLMAEAFSRRLGRDVTVHDIGVDVPAAESVPNSLWQADMSAALLGVCADRKKAPVYTVAGLIVPEWEDALEVRPQKPTTGLTVTREQVQDACQLVRLFSDTDLRSGGGCVRHALVGYLRSTIVPWLSAAASPSVRCQLLAIAARLSYLCGFTHFDDELHGTAQRYYLVSLRLAAAGGDAVGYACALRALSVQAAVLGHRAKAVDLAEAAVRTMPRQAPSHMRAFLLGQLAVAQAAMGNGRTARNTLATAEKELSRADGRSPGVAIYHPASLAHQQAVALASLGDHSAAVRLLEISLRHRPIHERRSRLITLGHLAELHARSGRLELACHTWHRFLDDYPLVTCRRADSVLRRMRARVRSHRTSSVTQALSARAAELGA